METANPTNSLGQITKYALRLGTIGFGGPVALVGYMHRDLVEQKKWISESEFKEGMTLAQLMPGPTADVSVTTNAWHMIKVEHHGNRIQCSLNGKVYLDIVDESI